MAGTPPQGRASEIVLYSDFNCPFCYVLSERLAALGAGDRVEWRGVEHAPGLAAPMEDAGAGLAAELEREVAAVRRLAPGLPIRVPSGKPNTRPAIWAAIQAVERHPRQAPAFVEALYRAFWVEGADLSRPAVLEQVARGCGIELTYDPRAGDERAAEWAGAWMESGVRAVPALVRSDGRTLIGLSGSAELAAFLFDGPAAREERTITEERTA